MQPSRLRSRVAARLRIAVGLQSYLEAHAPGAAILCYHGVIDRCSEPELESYWIDAATLNCHLQFLRRKYEPVPLSQIVAAVRDRLPIPNRWVAVSLDDALESQVTLAAEILAGHDIPWSLAVPAGLIGTGRSIWSYELSFLLLRCWESSTLPDPAGGAERLPMNSVQDRRAALARARKVVLGPSAGGLAVHYVNSLVAEFGERRFRQRLEEYGRYRLASWEQLRQAQSQGVELLAHGWNHLPQNAGLDDFELSQEVRQPRQRMQEMLGNAPRGFVFPHGRQTPDSCRIIQAAGYDFGLSSRPGRVVSSSATCDLPRYDGEHSLTILRRHLLTNSTSAGSAVTTPGPLSSSAYGSANLTDANLSQRPPAC